MCMTNDCWNHGLAQKVIPGVGTDAASPLILPKVFQNILLILNLPLKCALTSVSWNTYMVFYGMHKPIAMPVLNKLLTPWANFSLWGI